MAKPAYYPEWATEDTTLPATGQTNKVRPREVLRTTGWDKGQIPTCEEWNWILNNVYNWSVYFDGLLGTPTNLATANTLSLRDSTGSLHFYNLYVDNNLEVTGTGDFSGRLTAEGLSSSSGLTVSSGDTYLQGLTVSGSITSGGSNTWTGNNSFEGGLTVESAIDSGGSNVWSGTQSFKGEVSATGIWTFSATINSSATNYWTGMQDYSNAVSFGGDITSTGTNAWTGKQSYGGDNTHSGTETFSGTLNLKTSSKSTNGYTYLPNDVILQWGKVVIGTSGSTNVGADVSFPINFPSGVVSVTANTTTRYFNSADGFTAVCACTNQSNSGFTLYIDSDNAESLTVEQTINWMAIGY